MKGVLERLALLAGSTVLCLLLLEGALRLLGYPRASTRPDRVIGGRGIPGARYRWTDEGFSEGRMNAGGWRDRSYPEAKPAGTTRILVCGDSFVQAFQVALDSTFHKRLERELNTRARPGRRYEVIAMGQNGMGTTQEYLTYLHWGRRYDPDVVALLYFLNDPRDNWFEGSQETRPYFVEEGESLRLDTSFVHSPTYRRLERNQPLKEHSALVTLAGRVRFVLAQRLRPAPELKQLTDNRGWYHVWNFAVHPPADSIPALRLTARILGRFARDVRRDGRRFVVFLAGAAEQEDRGLLARNLEDPEFDPEKPQRWLARVGASHGFETVPLTPAFRAASASGRGRLWFGDGVRFGHWNELGHAVAAEVMAGYFDSTLLDRAASPAAGAAGPPGVSGRGGR